MRRVAWSLACLGVVIAGCGGGAPPTQKPVESPKPVAKAGAVEEWKLGKFSTADGMTTMVIDRTHAPKARFQITGTADIIELTPEEMRRRGDLEGYLFRAPDGTRTLFVGVHGDMLYLRGKDELPLRRDGDAAPLGDPTVKGDPPPPPAAKKSDNELTSERLTAISAMKKNPKLQLKDAMDPKAVGEAIAAADASMFVHFVGGAKPKASYEPVTFQVYHSKKASSDLTKGIGKYGAELFGLLDIEQGRGELELKHWGLQMAVPYDKVLAEGTPGIVWGVDGTSSFLFVTADGAPYRIDIWSDASTVAPGIEANVASWPAPLLHSALGPGELSHMAEANVFDKAKLADIDKTQDAWRTCVSTSFKKLQKDLTSLDKENLQWSAKAARKKEAKEKWEEKVQKECEANKTKMETLLVPAIEAHNKDRLAIYDKFKARAKELGLTK